VLWFRLDGVVQPASQFTVTQLAKQGDGSWLWTSDTKAPGMLVACQTQATTWYAQGTRHIAWVDSGGKVYAAGSYLVNP